MTPLWQVSHFCLRMECASLCSGSHEPSFTFELLSSVSDISKGQEDPLCKTSPSLSQEKSKARKQIALCLALMAISACLGSLKLFWLILMNFLNTWENIKMLSFKVLFLIYKVQNFQCIYSLYVIPCYTRILPLQRIGKHTPPPSPPPVPFYPFVPLIITSALTSQSIISCININSRNVKWEEAYLSSWEWLNLCNMVISSCIHFLWNGIASFFRAEKNSIMSSPLAGH